MESNAFTPNQDLVSYMGKNIFILVITVVIICIIIIIVSTVRNKDKRIYGEIKAEYEINHVDDNTNSEPIDTTTLECPMDINKYSYTFFLEISNFYCNTGYWKCIMIQGSLLDGKELTKCKSLIDDNELSDVDKKGIYDTYVGEFKDTTGTDEDSVKKKRLGLLFNSFFNGNNIENNKRLKFDNTDLFKRLDLVCRSIEVGDEGEKAFTELNHAFGFFKENENQIKMSIGNSQKLLDEHRTYCQKVYAVDKTIPRSDNDSLAGDNIKQYDNKFDNICNADNFIQKFPELIPMNLSSLKETELINLSELSRKHKEHAVKEDFNLEGCYSAIATDKWHTNNIGKVVLSGTDEQKNLNIINNDALEKGFEYFGRDTTGNIYYLLTKEELLKNVDKHKSNNKCEAINRKGETTHIFVSRVVQPNEDIVKYCWEDVLNNFSFQNPGLWLHPYVNNIRVVFTTKTDRDIKLQDFLSSHIHPNNLNSSNHQIKPINKQIEFEKPLAPSSSSCVNDKFDSTDNYYREYFDINNVPVQEEFHLSLIVNGTHVEVYINGGLFLSQVLFGAPSYNKGMLQIIPEQLNDNKDKLRVGTVVRNFKYFPKAIDYKNITKIMADRKAKQSRDFKPSLVPKDHGHVIELSHEHSYDELAEAEHKHEGADDISKSYYI